MKIKNIIQNILLLTFSVLFVLLILEVFLRVAAYERKKDELKKQETIRHGNEFIFYEYDRYLGWKNKPLAQGALTMPASRTFVKINSKGLRDKEYSYDKTEGIYRILVLGDSFTWGYGVETEEIFTERLEEMFDGNAEVINGGVTGYGTDQELLFLEREGVKYSPDVVVVALASNDFMWDNLAKKHGYYPKPFFEMENGQLKLTNVPLPELSGDGWEELLREQAKPKVKHQKRGFKGFLKRNTETYPFLSKSFKNLKYSLLRRLQTQESAQKLLNKFRITFSDESVNLDTTKAMFLRMNEYTKSIGASLAVYIIPYKSALDKLPNRFIDEFIIFFNENNIPCIYPYEEFLEERNRGEALYLYGDDHWSPRGHVVAAEQLYKFLDREKLLPG